MSIQKEIKRYMSSNYGNLISFGEPKFDEDRKIWKAQLKSDYPRIIRDDADPERRMLKFITLKGLGEIQLSEELKVVEATPRKKCVENLTSFLKMWLERAEKIVVFNSSEQLAKISGANWILNPVVMLVSNLLQKDFIEDWEVENDYRPKTTKQYLNLLEELELVERINNGWRCGNLLTALREKSTNAKDSEIKVLSYVIKERYSTIREIFDIRRFETFVHVDTCYYAPSLEAGKLLSRNEKSIYSDYHKLYHTKKSPLRLRYILNELVGVEALQRKESNYYYGNEEIFDNMLSMKDQLEEVSVPSAGSMPQF